MGATYPLGGTRHHHGTPWFVAEPAAGPKPNPLAPIPPTPVRQTARSRTPDVSRPDPEVFTETIYHPVPSVAGD